MNDVRYYADTFVFTARSSDSVINLRAGPDEILHVDGAVRINGTDDSTSVTTGAIVIAGGAGISGNFYSGGSINIEDEFVGSLLKIEDLNSSGTITTGTLVGLSGNLSTGPLVSESFNSTNAIISVIDADSINNDGSFKCDNLIVTDTGLTVPSFFTAKDINTSGGNVIGAAASAPSLNCVGTDNTFSFQTLDYRGTQQCTNISTGNIVMNGGIAAAGNLFCEGIVRFPGYFISNVMREGTYPCAKAKMDQMSMSTTSRMYHTFESSFSTNTDYIDFVDATGRIVFNRTGSYMFHVSYLSQVETSFQTILMGVQLNGVTDLTPDSFIDLIIGYNIIPHEWVFVVKIANLGLDPDYLRLWSVTSNGSATGTYQDASISIEFLNADYL